MKVAIFGQEYKKEASEKALKKLLECLEKYNTEVFINSDFLEVQPSAIKLQLSKKTYNSLNTSYDFVICIGGDGTILRAVTLVRDLNIPLIGINTGRLGFLATIKTENIEDAIHHLIKGDYNISERSLLAVSTSTLNSELTQTNFALNEVTVSRKNTTSMIKVKTHLNDEYLTSYWSDGLIVSTPTGSTGYSLSCGGPVITPGTANFVITPIAPHNLNARPLIIPDNTSIQLNVDSREAYFLLSLDSRILTISTETSVSLKKCDFNIKMVELTNNTFLNTLRQKLLWGEDHRN